MSKIKIGIVGYGNLGRGVEQALLLNPDMELAGVFTRRAPEQVRLSTPGAKACHVDDAVKFQGDIDVMILCGGSATDLPQQGPQFAKHFNTVDSFDTHAKIPVYFNEMDKVCQDAATTSIISVGWDPGLFSINRLYAEAILPEGNTYTFWGKGVSQGHSDAIRRIAGVKMAVQYTVPIEKAMGEVRACLNPSLSTSDKHLRDCYVVAEEGADPAFIETSIKSMPDYFADYHTNVTFITAAEFQAVHTAMPHGGFVMRSGKTGADLAANQMVEFSLKLDSNPEFTSCVLVAYARAAYRMAMEKHFGAKSVFDIAPSYLSPKSGETLRKELL